MVGAAGWPGTGDQLLRRSGHVLRRAYGVKYSAPFGNLADLDTVHKEASASGLFNLSRPVSFAMRSIEALVIHLGAALRRRASRSRCTVRAGISLCHHLPPASS